jgi:peptide/nickel transport system ATP-binding protein
MRPDEPAVPPEDDELAASTKAAQPVVLEARDLRVHFALRGGFWQRLTGRSSAAVRAVDGVDITLRRGEVLGVVGESGSGKTTLGRALLGLVPPTGGSVSFAGHELVGLRESELRPLRRRMQIVFQDPHAALSPSMDIATAVGHPLRIHRQAQDPVEVDRRVREALERVGLVPAERYLRSYPGDLSGGQKQRAVLARAIILGPELLIADEPVSMLDMSVRAKILELMIELQRDLGLSYVYITHDLATAKFFCDSIAIMYLGRVVEYGRAEEIYADPKHPYTRSLLAAIPEPDPDRAAPRDLPRGEVPDAARPPLGCSFHPRCPVAFEPCGWESRDLRAHLEARWTDLPVEQFERERALVGDLTTVEEPSPSLRITPGGGHEPAELLSLLETDRAENPDEPLWSGVSGLRADGSQVAVDFRPGIDPPLVPAGDSQVACLRYGGLEDEQSRPTRAIRPASAHGVRYSATHQAEPVDGGQGENRDARE